MSDKTNLLGHALLAPGERYLPSFSLKIATSCLARSNASSKVCGMAMLRHYTKWQILGATEYSGDCPHSSPLEAAE